MARKLVAATPTYLTVSNGVSVLNQYPFTFACFFQVTNPTPAGAQYLMCNAQAAGSDSDMVSLYVDHVSGKFGSIMGDTYVSSLVNKVLSANTWYSGVFVGISATSRLVYLNGGNVVTDTISVSLINRADRIWFGTYHGGTAGNVDGLITWPAQWNAALTASEAQAYHNGVSPLLIRHDNLVGFWPMNETGSYALDVSPRGRNATPTGNPRAYSDPPQLRAAAARLRHAMWALSPPAGGATAGLRYNSSLSGLGASGPFFHDRLAS